MTSIVPTIEFQLHNTAIADDCLVLMSNNCTLSKQWS